MRSFKRLVTGALLSRSAHADVFEVGPAPAFLFALFGGSGVDEQEYAGRGETVIPAFDPVLGGLERGGTSAVLCHITAPPDVPFNRFAAEPAARARWNEHVRTELLAPWAGWPFFVCGFSGGAALALNGFHADPRCFGGAALGADALPPGFVCPHSWRDRLRLYRTPGDRVCAHPTNLAAVETLIGRGQAEEFWLTAGGHRLADYATAECLGELIRHAAAIAPQ